MASFDVAFDWLMESEDPRRTWAAKIDNNGGGVIAGINSKTFPQAFADIQAIPQAERGLAVKTFYRVNFWNTWYAQLASDEVAKRVHDMAVNAGPATAVRLLQEALNEAGAPAVTIDGAWGPHTLGETNACDEFQLVSAFKACRSQYYREIAERNSADQDDLRGWLARAER